jgi:hypothetical protein
MLMTWQHDRGRGPTTNLAVRAYVAPDKYSFLIGTLVVAFALTELVLICFTYPGFPIIHPDSLTYLGWGGFVSIGYPMFLSSVYRISGYIEFVPIIQAAVSVVGSLALYRALSQFSSIAAAVIAVLVLSFTGALFYHFSLLTESLVTSLLVLHIAAFAVAVRTGSNWSFVFIGATAGAAMVLRPACYFLGLTMALSIVFWKERRWRFLFGSGGALLCVLAAAGAYDRAVRGPASHSMSGLALFPHVVHLFNPDRSDASEKVKNAVVSGRAKMMEMRARAPDALYRQGAEMANFNSTSHAISKELALSSVETNSLFLHLAVQTIMADPFGYLATIADNLAAAYYRFLLFEERDLSPELAPVWVRMTAQNIALDPRFAEQYRLPVPQSFPPVRLAAAGLLMKLDATLLAAENRVAAVRLAMLSVVALIVGATFRGPWRPIAIVGLYSALIHVSGTAFVCATTVFIPRYAVPLDPSAIMAFGCAVAVLFCAARHLARGLPARRDALVSSDLKGSGSTMAR